MDTLWLAPPHFVWQQFDAMDAEGALFGMTEETSSMNEPGSWYVKGKPSAPRTLPVQCVNVHSSPYHGMLVN